MTQEEKEELKRLHNLDKQYDYGDDATNESNRSEIVNDLISSKGLGSVSRTKDQTRADEILGWHKLPLHILRSKGEFLPKGTVIKIRPVNTPEVKHFSTVNEEDIEDVSLHLNYMLENCLQITAPDKRVSYLDLADEDRFVIILKLRELSFPKPEERRIEVTGRSQKGKIKKIPIELETLQFHEISDRLKPYYSEETRCYNITTKSCGVIKLWLPTIGVMQQITDYIKEKNSDGKEWDRAFVGILPYIVEDWRNLDNKRLFELEIESKSWSKKKFSIVTDLIKEFKVGILPELQLELDGVTYKAPLDFPDGIKSLFIVSNLADELV